MSTLRLIINSLKHYWRTNLAVLLGVIAGTAVIAGALIVGDSVRGSLQQMTLDRLGKIDYAMNSHRFFLQVLSDDMAAQLPSLLYTSPSPRDRQKSRMPSSA